MRDVNVRNEKGVRVSGEEVKEAWKYGITLNVE